MTRVEFDNCGFSVNTWVNYDGGIKYVIAVSFEEALFALVDEKENVPVGEWNWVRCESVALALNRCARGKHGE